MAGHLLQVGMGDSGYQVKQTVNTPSVGGQAPNFRLINEWLPPLDAGFQLHVRPLLTSLFALASTFCTHVLPPSIIFATEKSIFDGHKNLIGPFIGEQHICTLCTG